VIDRHLLVVTRELVEQTEPLVLEDFAALWSCMPVGAGPEALGFYNSGPEAGASQRHRHLQVVPMPVGGPQGCAPFDGVFERAGAHPGVVAGLPFPHAAARLELDGETESEARAAATLDLYRRCLREVGRDEARPGPYNLLVTRQFLCIVPRRRECFGPVSVNALGFWGVLLARDRAELAALRAAGPLHALRSVAG
jgi:ATP adenylyltransferase